MTGYTTIKPDGGRRRQPYPNPVDIGVTSDYIEPQVQILGEGVPHIVISGPVYEGIDIGMHIVPPYIEIGAFPGEPGVASPGMALHPGIAVGVFPGEGFGPGTTRGPGIALGAHRGGRYNPGHVDYARAKAVMMRRWGY